jgi:hypothetical protein
VESRDCIPASRISVKYTNVWSKQFCIQKKLIAKRATPEGAEKKNKP